ncbi:MAG: metallophosphoesterase [Clostridia bacterium]|nr:metallophosphoesterase [Clostridia bacterium]
MKITAFGDLHLDSAFSAFGLRESSKRREMLRNIFSNIISLVKENQSDLLLISGDLFDVPAPTPESASLVRRELSSLDIPVFITPGNHDYYIPNGIYDKMPENVYVFKNEPLESITVDSLGICVDGYAFISDSYERNPLSTAENNCDAPIHILCAHTDMTPGSKYAPFTEKDLEKSNYTFAALGHVHTKTDILTAGMCTAIYSGVIQGKGPDEPQNGCVNVIELDKNGISAIERVDVSLWNNLIFQVSVDGAISDSDIINRIKLECPNSFISEHDTLRIELVGEYDFRFSPNLNYVTAETRKLFDGYEITVKNYSSPKLDREALISDPSVAGVLYRRLFTDPKIVDAYPESVRTRAFNLSLKALVGDDIDPENI